MFQYFALPGKERAILAEWVRRLADEPSEDYAERSRFWNKQIEGEPRQTHFGKRLTNEQVVDALTELAREIERLATVIPCPYELGLAAMAEVRRRHLVSITCLGSQAHHDDQTWCRIAYLRSLAKRCLPAAYVDPKNPLELKWLREQLLSPIDLSTLPWKSKKQPATLDDLIRGRADCVFLFSREEMRLKKVQTLAEANQVAGANDGPTIDDSLLVCCEVSADDTVKLFVPTVMDAAGHLHFVPPDETMNYGMTRDLRPGIMSANPNGVAEVVTDPIDPARCRFADRI